MENNKTVKKKRVLLLADIGGYGPDYHVGDEAMAEVAIERLAKLFGKSNLIMGSSSTLGIQETYNIKPFRFYQMTDNKFFKLLFRRPWSYIINIFRNIYVLLKVDAVFICGGGNMTSVWPHVLESRLRLVEWANRLNKDVYLVSQTLGPYSEIHRERVQKVLKKAKWVGVRDKTFSHTQVDFPVNFAVDDACFLEPMMDSKITKLISDAKNYCCVSMRFFGNADNNNLLELSQTIADLANEQSLRTIFVPHHAPGGIEGDIKLANSVSHAWNEESPLIIVDPIPMAASLKALTAKSEWVITMRYHQLIFALSMGIPSVGVFVNEYTEAKLRGAFEQFNLEPKIVSIVDVKEKLPGLIKLALNNKDEFKHAANYVAVEEKSRSLKAYDMVLK